jgi:(E)-4-hydroxy-3-methylbut-2-enyl-diphosphate synthase
MSKFPEKYCLDIHNYERFPTRVVKVGDFGVGGTNPIRLQSMTNVPVEDIKNTVIQSKKIFDAGADFVRIATPRVMDVESLKTVKKILNEDGYKKPLIADVHFNPIIAEEAARVVEKIRINPGNYVDKKSIYDNIKYTENEYNEELNKIHERIRPLIRICKEYGTAIRVGSNHGSLSDRILSRYGNTVQGMVEAALEYLDIFVAENFYNIIVSMKASDTRTMIKACRLLNAEMLQSSIVFPQHLGVTEAGAGEDGRLKSAVGIGAILADGIGDTIRVSLTESPEIEIPFAKKITDSFYQKKFKYQLPAGIRKTFDPFVNKNNSVQLPLFNQKYITIADCGTPEDCLADLIFCEYPCEIKPENKYVFPYKLFRKMSNHGNIFPLFNQDEVSPEKIEKCDFSFVEMNIFDMQESKNSFIYETHNICIIFNTRTDAPTGEVRLANTLIHKSGNKLPIIVKYLLDAPDREGLLAEAGVFPGAVIVDSLVSGIWLRTVNKTISTAKLGLELLQAADLRFSKAAFISCPSCGRTQFDIERICEEVKKTFSHLKGLKIAVMGCLVNGPGEMADADYGCVGAKKNEVHIYKGKTPVLKNINQDNIIENLKKIIIENGDWKEK